MRSEIPDLKAFGELGSIRLRGSIVEVKNVKKLEGRKQLRDLIEFVKDNGLKLEIFVKKGTKIPNGGVLGKELASRKFVRVIELK